jgi:predicted ATP-dependent endonuclease of OLD family
MKLKQIKISNYRSIENIQLALNEVNGSSTFALLGINESGKSSFLQALSLLESGQINHPLDYFNQKEEVSIQMEYELEVIEIKDLSKILEEKGFPRKLTSLIEIKKVNIVVEYSPDAAHPKNKYEVIEFQTDKIPGYTLNGLIPILMPEEGEHEVLSIKNYFTNYLNGYFLNLSHKVVFWKSSPEYLILEEIDLNLFAANPDNISVPLLNCFKLAGIKQDDIPSTVAELTSSVPISNLQEKLTDLVTKHINLVWPDHPIRIKFQISSNKISLLIEDQGVQYSVKTTSQRSDGFRQFISFLLTLSVENHNGQLSNTILLIDEPEVHLHPPAQINLLNELIEITKNKRNNIVFFATHSNYLIDKKNLDRCYKVIKLENHRTVLEKIEKTNSSYAEVNYEVFEIPTTDYHNELYGFIEDTNNAILEKLDKDMIWKNARNGKEENVSLSKYIRHSIHHPENTKNKIFTDKQLRKSIDLLRTLKYT